MRTSIIAAVAENGVIGRDNALPWRLSADLKRFKRLTMGHTLVMGRRTFESIGKPLPGRRTIVLSRSEPELPAGVVVAGSLDAALAIARAAGETEVFVAGGAAVFAEALTRAERLYLTRVEAEVVGDVTFPEWDPRDWRLASSERHDADVRNMFRTRFEVWERRERDADLPAAGERR